MSYTFERTCSRFIKGELDRRLKPCIVFQSEQIFVVKFDNITNTILWYVSRSKCKLGWYYDSSVFASLNCELSDIVYSSDLKGVRYPWGQYYCGLCPFENRVRHNSLQDLLVEHLLRPTNDFYSNKLVVNKCLVFLDYDGMCVVRLVKDKSDYDDSVDGTTKVTYVDIFK